MKRSDVYIKAYNNYSTGAGLCHNITKNAGILPSCYEYPEYYEELFMFTQEDEIRPSSNKWLFNNRRYENTFSKEHIEIRKTILYFAYIIAKSNNE